ncbi:glycosyltransferase family 4 protein [Shewanella sp. WPAGA9]|uniref:glycosyltransferase family 4 protein n=1 Tax=Shewanella sp. ENK2 TaxID=2775245 RepID=UPI001784E0CB|nr:glycosyltransferase family 4 protein [Shewanella sp. WPAGA9]
MKNIFIIYRSMFTPQGEVHTIGGIENYIMSLIETFKTQQWRTQIVQPAKTSFCLEREDVIINGVTTGIYRGNSKKFALAQWVKQHAKEGDVVIFATDSYAVKIPGLATVGIQHGVSWDKPQTNSSFLGQFVSSLLNHYKYLKFARKSDTLICVDHNFVNWYRTWCSPQAQQIKVIYNFYQQRLATDQLLQKWAQSPQPLKLIIARRFVDYRGIAIIAPVIEKLLNQFEHLEVTFAGEGPLQPLLEKAFAKHPRVTITQYQAQESFHIHQQHHIAVIPTLGSEGTSLSMIEAMAAGCLVISSNVGGLSNLIIDGYNGHLVMPNANEFERVIYRAINDMNQTQQLAINGYESIKHVCSQAQWSRAWVDVIKSLPSKACH